VPSRPESIMRPLYIQLLHSELILLWWGSQSWLQAGFPAGLGRAACPRQVANPPYFAGPLNCVGVPTVAAATGIKRYDMEVSEPEMVRKLGPAVSPAGTVTLS